MQHVDAVAVNEADYTTGEVFAKNRYREEENNHEGGTSASRKDSKP
jgi:hypothetical protein